MKGEQHMIGFTEEELDYLIMANYVAAHLTVAVGHMADEEFAKAKIHEALVLTRQHLHPKGDEACSTSAKIMAAVESMKGNHSDFPDAMARLAAWKPGEPVPDPPESASPSLKAAIRFIQEQFRSEEGRGSSDR